MSLSHENTSLRDKVVANYFRYIALIESIMSKGIEDRFLKAINPRVMACVLLGTIRSFTYNWMLAGDRDSLSSKIDMVIDIFMTGVRAEVDK